MTEYHGSLTRGQLLRHLGGSMFQGPKTGALVPKPFLSLSAWVVLLLDAFLMGDQKVAFREVGDFPEGN